MGFEEDVCGPSKKDEELDYISRVPSILLVELINPSGIQFLQVLMLDSVWPKDNTNPHHLLVAT
jgi:hypothetical protein